MDNLAGFYSVLFGRFTSAAEAEEELVDILVDVGTTWLRTRPVQQEVVAKFIQAIICSNQAPVDLHFVYCQNCS